MFKKTSGTWAATFEDNTTNPTMKRQLLGINNTIPLSVTQDTLNPVLRQTIWRHITIDSLFRPNPIPYNFSPNTPNGNETNFTVNLSETLRDDYFAAINSGNDASLNIIGPEVFSQLAAISLDGFPSFPDGYWQTTTAGAVLYGIASVPPDLLGSEYLLLTLDDYTNNYPINGLISIGPADTKLSIPSYVSKITDPLSNICGVSANNVVP